MNPKPEKLTIYIKTEELDILNYEDAVKRKEAINKNLRPKVQGLIAPVFSLIERIIGIDIFWYSRISISPFLTAGPEDSATVAYGIEPRKNEPYGKGRDTLNLILRFEIKSHENIGTVLRISGKYDKSRFALLFHEYSEDIVNLMQNAFIYGIIKQKEVDLTTVEKVLDFLETYFTSEDDVTFFGPVDVLRPKEEIHAGVLLRFLTLFPLYQGIIESALQRESNFNVYYRKAIDFMSSV